MKEMQCNADGEVREVEHYCDTCPDRDKCDPERGDMVLAKLVDGLRTIMQALLDEETVEPATLAGLAEIIALGNLTKAATMKDIGSAETGLKQSRLWQAIAEVIREEGLQ